MPRGGDKTYGIIGLFEKDYTVGFDWSVKIAPYSEPIFIIPDMKACFLECLITLNYFFQRSAS